MSLDVHIDLQVLDDLQEQINEEKSVRESADNHIQNDIGLLQDADNTLQNNIDILSTDLNQEVVARQNADSNLQTQIDNHSSAINDLSDDLSQEVSNRQDADTVLQNQIDANETNILNEAITRAQADADEQAARIAADNDLQAQIDDEIANREQAIIDAVDDLKDGVASPGDTLQKLYNLILANVHEAYVADIASRNAYNVPSLPFSIFVTDDGDGNWAKYQATTTGVGATFVKISDPDLLNAAMSAAQIKAAYESNPDTNAFTNALLAKLNGIAAGATANDTDANLKNRANHTGTQDASTITGTKTSSFISDFVTAAQAAITNTWLGSFIAALTAKSTPIDADGLVISDTADSGKAKFLSFTNLWNNYIKVKSDTRYAQLTDSRFIEVVTLSAAITSLTPSSVFQFGNNPTLTASSSNTGRVFCFSFVGTVKKVVFGHTLAGTVGSNHPCDIYLRNVTTGVDYSLGQITYDQGANTNTNDSFACNIAVPNTTDFWTIKIATGAFTTNPTNTYNNARVFNQI